MNVSFRIHKFTDPKPFRLFIIYRFGRYFFFYYLHLLIVQFFNFERYIYNRHCLIFFLYGCYWHNTNTVHFNINSSKTLLFNLTDMLGLSELKTSGILSAVAILHEKIVKNAKIKIIKKRTAQSKCFFILSSLRF